MERLKVLLKSRKKRKRRVRHSLIQFFETIGLYLQAGYDLGYGWPESLKAIREQMPRGLALELSQKGDEPVNQVLFRLSENFEIEGLRIWFSVIYELYQNGAGLSHSISSIASTLRSEHARDLENHLQRLPSKTNILVILFFLPPTFLLLFYPLLLEITSSF